MKSMTLLFVVLGLVSSGLPAVAQEPSQLTDWSLTLGQKDKPAILLVHGLWQDASSTWIKPTESLPFAGIPVFKGRDPVPSFTEQKKVKPVLPRWDAPVENKAVLDERNWHDALVEEGFTVALWSQGKDAPRGPLHGAQGLQPEVEPALEALRRLARQSDRLDPQNPRPIALLGHSRGGLLIRMMLKRLQQEDPNGLLGRVRWVITLNSPHRGSALARICSKSQDYAAQKAAITALFAGVGMGSSDLATIVSHWPDLAQSLCDIDPQGAFLKDLEEGERPVRNVVYHSFGGTHPTFWKVYKYVCNDSRTFRVPKMRSWTFDLADSRQFPPVHGPIVEALKQLTGIEGPFSAEWTVGEGDFLVSNVSAKLPWGTHTAKPLNHVEVLWDTEVQQEVLALLEQPYARIGGRR